MSDEQNYVYWIREDASGHEDIYDHDPGQPSQQIEVLVETDDELIEQTTTRTTTIQLHNCLEPLVIPPIGYNWKQHGPSQLTHTVWRRRRDRKKAREERLREEQRTGTRFFPARPISVRERVEHAVWERRDIFICSTADSLICWFEDREISAKDAVEILNKALAYQLVTEAIEGVPQEDWEAAEHEHDESETRAARAKLVEQVLPELLKRAFKTIDSEVEDAHATRE